jgi:anti-sigma factor RsiW
MSENHLGDTLHAYVDNELSVERALEVRSHLASCARCRQDFERVRALSDVLQRTLRPSEPSADFFRKMHASIERADPSRWQRRARRAAWASGPFAAAALVLLFLLPGLRRPSTDLTGEVVASHLRSLQAGHLTDVASSDRHTVKPWFQGKLPFSFSVRDFREQGFALEGGRLDYVDGQPAAALVYKVREHVINVFVWPSSAAGDATPRRDGRAGIHALHWTSDGMSYWLASDVDEEELGRLAALLRTPTP